MAPEDEKRIRGYLEATESCRQQFTIDDVRMLIVEIDQLRLEIEQLRQPVLQNAAVPDLTKHIAKLEEAVRQYADKMHWACHDCDKLGTRKYHNANHIPLWVGPGNGPSLAKAALDGNRAPLSAMTDRVLPT